MASLTSRTVTELTYIALHDSGPTIYFLKSILKVILEGDANFESEVSIPKGNKKLNSCQKQKKLA